MIFFSEWLLTTRAMLNWISCWKTCRQEGFITFAPGGRFSKEKMRLKAGIESCSTLFFVWKMTSWSKSYESFLATGSPGCKFITLSFSTLFFVWKMTSWSKSYEPFLSTGFSGWQSTLRILPKAHPVKSVFHCTFTYCYLIRMLSEWGILYTILDYNVFCCIVFSCVSEAVHVRAVWNTKSNNLT